MAGGKETPRQKMIGMMYLVLTALLALNVSKSILDAFVAIEENIQISNENEFQRGEEKLAELKEKSEDKSVPDAMKKAKLLMKTVEEIDKMTAARIKEIDDLKMEILTACGESTSEVGGKESIIFEKFPAGSLKPTRMKLDHVEGKDKYDEPMHIMIGDEITAPSGKGMDLWNNYNKFRNDLTEIIASSMPSEGKKFFFKAPKINEYKDLTDLYSKIDKSIAASNVSPDDKDVIKKIYASLTKNERSEVHEVKNVHWIGKTFDHAPSVAALASLSSMQKEILTARADAVALIRARVGGGEYSFNKIMALAYGPEIANSGEEVEVQVLMAAFDSDKKPIVTMGGSTVSDVRDGKAYIKTKGSGAEMKLGGTITILNKSGVAKTLPWEKTIKIMKPQGTVSLPEMNMLYRGYNNIVEGVASGYDETVLSGSGVSLTKSGGQYIGRVSGTGREASITVSGRNNVTKKTESLGVFKFRVSNLPPPQLYLGTLSNGGTASASAVKAMSALFMKYPPEIPLKAVFEVGTWEVSVSGAPRTVQGSGKSLSPEALNLIKQARPGNTVSISGKFKGPNSGFAACVIKVN